MTDINYLGLAMMAGLAGFGLTFLGVTVYRRLKVKTFICVLSGREEYVVARVVRDTGRIHRVVSHHPNVEAAHAAAAALWVSQ